jgi:hypothetical protein
MLRRTWLLAGLVLCLTLAFATSANALTGSPIGIQELEFAGPPAVAVDSLGTAYVAWADEKENPYTVHYCVLVLGAAGCAHTGTLTPSGGSVKATIDGVKVLVDGSTVVVLADVYGVGQEYTPEQEWQSTDSGASFTPVDGGKSVADGILSAVTGPVNPVVVPGTNALGYAWVTAGGAPTFAEFPLNSPPKCSQEPLHECPFATLQPEGEYMLGNPHGEVASKLGTGAGVLGVYETLGKPGCASGTFDSAFVYGSGEQSASNSYNKSPGTAGSAWKALTPGDCEVDYIGVGGGASGLGVVEDDLATGSTVYHRFDQTNEDFDTPYSTISSEGEQSPSVSQDASGGVYATFLAGLNEVRLAYSYDGGTTWSGPATLSGASSYHLASNVNGSGQGWATWASGNTIYAQQFNATDSIAPPSADSVVTTQTVGTTTGASVEVPAGTVGETDHATITGANAALATGTVTYHLFSTPTCAGGSEVFNGGLATVNGGVAGSSVPVISALAQGSYYWQADYSGNTGSIFGVKGNAANASSCGGEVLTIGPPIPVSTYRVASVVENSNGTVTITFVPTQSGEATVVVTIPTGSIARTTKCKKGQIKIHGKCLPANTSVGKASAKGTGGVPLKLKVTLSSKVRGLLAKGKTEHVTATLTYKSVYGGSAYSKTFHLTIKGKKAKHH